MASVPHCSAKQTKARLDSNTRKTASNAHRCPRASMVPCESRNLKRQVTTIIQERSAAPYSGLLNVVCDNALLFVVVMLGTGSLPNIPDQTKETRLTDSWRKILMSSTHGSAYSIKVQEHGSVVRSSQERWLSHQHHCWCPLEQLQEGQQQEGSQVDVFVHEERDDQDAKARQDLED